MKKLLNYMKFSTTFKLPKLIKKKPDEVLIELYDTYSPYIYNRDKSTPFINVVYGTTIVYIVIEELKKRHKELSSIDYTKEVNLHEIIRKYN